MSRSAVLGLALRALVGLAPVLALLASGPAGSWPQSWLIALTVALSVGFAAMPESPLGTVVLVVVVLWWAVVADHAMHTGTSGVPVMALPAALLVLVAHVAAIPLSYGARSMAVEETAVRLWLRRALTVAVAAPVVWLLADVLEGEPEVPGIWVAGLVAGIAVCLVAAVAVGDPET